MVTLSSSSSFSVEVGEGGFVRGDRGCHGALQLRRPTSPNPKCYAYYARS